MQVSCCQHRTNTSKCHHEPSLPTHPHEAGFHLFIIRCTEECTPPFHHGTPIRLLIINEPDSRGIFRAIPSRLLRSHGAGWCSGHTRPAGNSGAGERHESRDAGLHPQKHCSGGIVPTLPENPSFAAHPSKRRVLGESGQTDSVWRTSLLPDVLLRAAPLAIRAGPAGYGGISMIASQPSKRFEKGRSFQPEGYVLSPVHKPNTSYAAFAAERMRVLHGRFLMGLRPLNRVRNRLPVSRAADYRKSDAALALQERLYNSKHSLSG